MMRIVGLLLLILPVVSLKAQSSELSVSGTGEEKVYLADVQEMPSYKGDTLENFLGKRTFYPEGAVQQGVSGTVYVSFVVLENGELSDLKVFKGIGSGCDEEAVRVVQLTSGHWLPGRRNGKPVKVFYYLPVKFSLS